MQMWGLGLSARSGRKRGLGGVAIFVVLVMMAAACGGSSDSRGDSQGSESDSESLPVVRLQGIEAGLASVAPRVIEEQGFDESNGFEGEILFPSFDAHDQDFLQGRADVTSTDVMNVSLWRTQDFDVVAFYPEVSMMITVAVAEDSPYESMEDLLGKKIGHFGASSGASITMAIMLQEFYGIDFYEDYELIESSPAALPDLLAGGDVEAIVTFDPHLSKALVNTPGRVLYEPGKDWAEKTGGQLWITNLVAFEDWLTDNPDLAYRVRDAYTDAYAYIEDNPEILGEEPYASLMGLAGSPQEVIDLFISRATAESYWESPWGETERDGANDFVDIMAEMKLLELEQNPGGATTSLEELVGPSD